MSARALLEAAAAEGLTLGVEGHSLIIETDRDPPAELLAKLRQHKGEILALLRPLPESADMPRNWTEGYAALAAMPPPTGFSPERWERLVRAAGKFVARWGADAARLGWSTLDVFGAHQGAPASRFDAMGLVLLLNRCEVVGIDQDGADVVTVTDARQRFRRRPLPPGTVPLWELAR